MKLSELLYPIKVVNDMEIKGIASNSADVKDGYLFIAINGLKTDGTKFIPDAIKQGAVAILTNKAKVVSDIPVYYVSDIRRMVPLIASRFYRDIPPHIIGITGTNGKTSTVTFIRQILKLCGIKSASIGTLGVESDDYNFYTSTTSPDPILLYQSLNRLYSDGVKVVGIEVSSHALDQNRFGGLKFDVIGFTNFTQDHLDYHRTMEEYFNAKKKLFTSNPKSISVLNADIDEFKELKALNEKHISYGKNGDIRLNYFDLANHRISLSENEAEYITPFKVAGDFQAYNLMCAIACCRNFVSMEQIVSVIHQLSSPVGRMEKVAQTLTGGIVLTDYAHTPDGLEKALMSARKLCQNKLYVIFGCGGNRDKTKRPLMGKIADKLADYAIVTDDNPRYECPADIRSEILSAMRHGIEIGSRSKAIAHALMRLRKGDVLLIAGKGHEEGQEINGVVYPFNDKIQTQYELRAIEENPIWTSPEISMVLDVPVSVHKVAYGMSFDSRTLKVGDIYIALTGGQKDGHLYVKDALKKGAVYAIVEHDVADVEDKDSLIIVKDTMVALRSLAQYARQRSNATFIGVTGSSGKTTTRQMIVQALKPFGLVHTTRGNFNNHIGVPLTLCNMPTNTEYAVIEMGMNHHGELLELSKMVRPHISLITMIGLAHLEYFKSLQDIALAKSEIFVGQEKGGVVILNQDDACYDFLYEKVIENGLKTIFSFGENKSSDIRLEKWDVQDLKSQIEVQISGQKYSYSLSSPGRHFVQNTLSALAVAKAIGLDIQTACQSLNDMDLLDGRGKVYQIDVFGKNITLIDDAYNANPSSMQASIEVLGKMSGRRVAILGDMKELGAQSEELHIKIGKVLLENKINIVYTIGSFMKKMFETLPNEMKGKAFEHVDEIDLKDILKEGDVVLIKSSNSMKLFELTLKLKG